jgi:hypothetical protein
VVTRPNIADLHRHPADVAKGLTPWRRGDHAEAVAETLQLAVPSTFTRAYTAWVWAGSTPGGEPAWLLPVTSAAAEQYRPKGTMTVLCRCLAAAVDCGASPTTVQLVDWDGLTGVLAPGLDPELAAVALADRHPQPGRAEVATLPRHVTVDGPPLELAPTPAGPGGIAVVADALRVHPLRVALALLEHGWDLEDPDYPPDAVEVLRHRGLEGPVRRADEPSVAIEDDPCPRRRHARRVLRRLLHKRKVGAQYHTEFSHLARGAPPEDRADALQIGEALLRAGLLGEKPSVGQRHVYLRREALPAIHALIDRGETTAPGLSAEWTAPAPGGGRR